MEIKSKLLFFVQNFVQKIKRDKFYTIDKNIEFIDFTLISSKRFRQLLRGRLSRAFGLNVKGNFFRGNNVIIEHRAHINMGYTTIIEDNVFINALGLKGITIGNNVTIQRGAILQCTGVIQNLGVGITLHDNVGINARAYLGGQGGITIHRNVILGPDVKIFSENHVYMNKNVPIKQQGEIRKEVIINEDCWIGSGVIILAGVILGKGCVVAAGSVVTKSFPDYSIIGGIPAVFLKSRG